MDNNLLIDHIPPANKRANVAKPIPQEWVDILTVLSVQPRTVGEIQFELGLVQETVSNRLTKMRQAGLVKYTQVKSKETGKTVHRYQLIPAGIKAAVADIRATASLVEELIAPASKKTRPRRQNG
jgi:predicted ArsR family transcriptional regulator